MAAPIVGGKASRPGKTADSEMRMADATTISAPASAIGRAKRRGIAPVFPETTASASRAPTMSSAHRLGSMKYTKEGLSTKLICANTVEAMISASIKPSCTFTFRRTMAMAITGHIR